MKLNYKNQIILTVIIIIIANIITEVFHHWIYRSIGFGIYGLIHIIHPVIPQYAEPTKLNYNAIRLADIILILIGIFTRVYPS